MLNFPSSLCDTQAPVKVSVIVPVYGVEKYIKECLDSILEQSLEAIELICIDDRSPDNSAAIIAEVAEKDPRVRLIRNVSNLGVAASRNIGLRAARGEFIKIIDSDDYLMPSALELLADEAERQQLDIVFHDALKLHEDGSFSAFSCPGQDRPLERMRGDAAWWYLFRRRIFEHWPEIQFPEGAHPHEDTAFSFMLISHCANSAHISRELVCYRQHEEMVTRRMNQPDNDASQRSAGVCILSLVDFFKALEKPIRARRRQAYDSVLRPFYRESRGCLPDHIKRYFLMWRLRQFIYQSKYTSSGYQLVKIFKVPVHYKKLH